jgi:glycerol-3-phosphate dehydrogenase subunit C
MGEGSLEAPVRHPLDWRDADFVDAGKLDEELRRVFDVCHGCRRCFNLCDSFPRLFDLIDESETMELDSVDSKDFQPVVDACTLCDMCFMTKCPYVPPHEFAIDFPHLMLRVRRAERIQGDKSFIEDQLAETDRNGKLARPIAGLANWASNKKNKLTRPVLEAVAKIHKDAELPKYQGKTLEQTAHAAVLPVNKEAPAFGRKAVLYATCYGNFNKTEIGLATRAILAKNGVETHIVHPACCGMPKLEQGDLDGVEADAKAVSAALKLWIEKDYDVIALVPSCALMLKFEWPLIMPDDPDVKQLAAATFDVAEYVVDIAKKEGLADGLKTLPGGVNMHLACHARAQNMGAKAVDLLKLIPDADVHPIERCSGHGGSWGIMKDNFEVALKVGKPVARDAVKSGKPYVASECPLAADHILQGMERIDGASVPERTYHPIELFALAYGIEVPR